MFSALAGLINRHPRRVLAVALMITGVAAPLGIHVRDYLKPRGFDVAGSGSATAREIRWRRRGAATPSMPVLQAVQQTRR